MQKTELIIFIIVGISILFIFIIGIVLFLVRYSKRKRDHETEKEILATQHAREIVNTQLEIQLQTMQHIGREIHDNVGQQLVLASLYAQQLAFENKAPQVTEKIEHIGQIIDQSLSELRKLSKSLTDDTISSKTLSELIQQEVIKFNKLKKCTVCFDAGYTSKELSYQDKNVLLRIVQEFLQNGIKHSGCSLISIELKMEPDTLSLNLSDNGKGFDPNLTLGTGIGLINIRKRAGIINASCSIVSSPGKGTSLLIEKKTTL